MDVKNDLSGGKPTLLIAEDEESNYLLLKTILHKYCNLIRAKTGLEALALFKENEVDLILMDIKMPSWMDTRLPQRFVRFLLACLLLR